MNLSNRIRVAYALLFALAAFGCLWNLDDRRLWGDEAETALLAANIVETGVPRVSDGQNTISNLPGRRDANADGVWTWSPWLDEYVTAASLSVFGSTAWAARLPFAMLGLLAVLLLARVAYRSYESHSVALIATALLATCVPFLLHVRQARYYAIVVFAQVWLLHGIRQSFRQPGWRAALHVALPLAVLFYSNYILALAPVLAVGAIALWRMRSHPDSFRCLAGAGGLFAALAIPWLIYAAPWNQLGGLGAGSIPENIVYYVREAHRHVLPLWLLALPLGWLAVRRIRRIPAPARPAPETQALEVFGGSILVLSLVVYALSPFRFFRYLVPLIPVLFLLSSVYLTRAIGSAVLRTALVLVAIAASSLGWEQSIRASSPAESAGVG
ncbi:MAG: glycosyltransferase family 39 protein, partial [Myxococcota bacterium]|nr:glycosyltransferase family 39 protein [Myxococcota bacterium]